MPAAIPVIAAFGSGAVGAVVAGTATFAQFATVAGAIMSGVGALTGSESLSKIGAVLSVGGVIGGAIAGAGSAAAAAGGEGAFLGEGVPSGVPAWDGAAGGAGVSEAGAAGAGAFTQPVVPGAEGADAVGPFENPDSIMARAAQAKVPGAPDSSLAGGNATAPITAEPAPVANVISDGKLAEAAKGLTAQDLSTWWQKAQAMGKGVGEFINKNPGLTYLGGQMLSSMYGPEAEQMDFQKGIYERRIRNLNSPVRLAYTPPGGK
jgi:hypothetical protein